MESAMIFRQLFDSVSSTYSYLLASRRGGEALIIDPVLDKVEVVSMRVAEGDRLTVEGLSLEALYTPGHTDDSYCFMLGDRVFTGDTLLIRGTGRTDFQNGDSRAQYESLQRLMRLPDETLVFPAHDYKGDTVSTIAEEKRFNPRLRVRDAEEYAALMAGRHLPDPKMMDVAIPANIHQGLHQEEVARRGWAYSAEEGKALVGRSDVALIDLREKAERERTGAIPGSLHAPYADLQDNIDEGGLIHELAASGRTIVFYCAFGERSAMAVQAAQDKGLASARHIEGGMAAWTKAGGERR